jgi:hypothetical protein
VGTVIVNGLLLRRVYSSLFEYDFYIFKKNYKNMRKIQNMENIKKYDKYDKCEKYEKMKNIYFFSNEG